jgi:hypothetical protein
MFDFHELREIAADVRIYVDAAEDKASALRDVIAAHDIVLGIFPSGDGIGIYAVKGKHILEKIANSKTTAHHTHTAIAVPDLAHAEILQQLTLGPDVSLAA